MFDKNLEKSCLESINLYVIINTYEWTFNQQGTNKCLKLLQLPDSD